MPQQPSIRPIVMQTIEHCGPISRAEIQRLTGLSEKQLTSCLHHIRRAGLPVRIAQWKRQPPGKKGSMIPLYAIGTTPDARKPPPIAHRVRDAAYRERHRAIYRLTKGVNQSDPFAQMRRTLC